MFLKQFRLIVWKNLIIRKRHWFLTLCECILPVLFFLLVAYGRTKIENFSKINIDTPTYPNEYPGDILIQRYFDVGGTYLYYTPENEFTADLIKKVQEKLQLLNDAIVAFAAEDALLEYYAQKSNRTTMAVVFKQADSSSLSYTIRVHEDHISWDTDKLFQPSPMYVPESGSQTYKYKGVLALQYALDKSYVETVNPKNEPFPFMVQFQEFPYPPYKSDSFVSDMVLYFLPLLTLFSFIFLCPAVLKRVVEEKNSGAKELLKMVGMKRWMLWLGWYLHAKIVNVTSIIFIVILMKTSLWGTPYPPIEYCDWSVFFVFLFLYCTAAITFCFFISTFFNRPSIAMVFGISIWILSYFIPVAIVYNYQMLPYLYKVLLAFLPNMALSLGYTEISVYEIRELGSSWNNICVIGSGSPTDLSLGSVFIILILQAVIYTVSALYIECINPGPYGIKRKFYYPITDLIEWVKRHSSGSVENLVSESDREETSLRCVEEGRGLTPAIEIKNLCKRYGHHQVLNGVSLDIYENQITVLLGHNGAGKTTTMSVITGMTEGNGGSVLINGHDIKKDMDKVRESMGLCPQHNLLFPDLTVIEHLLFFAMLKGLSSKEAEVKAVELLHRLRLAGHLHSLPGALSGGQKRKLCLGMAVIGHTKVLVLDEPTSGMDPESRREVWDLLLEWRGSRTVLITTHFMEEADVLGDWIAIMRDGQTYCYGTPMYLKRKYDTGYRLSVMLNSEIFEPQITTAVRSCVPNMKLKYSQAKSLVYVLPTCDTKLFPGLLKSVEKEEGVSNISISITTLEDVFLKTSHEVTSDSDTKEEDKNLNSSIFYAAPEDASDFKMVRPLLHKHGLFLKRKWRHQLLPTLVTALIMFLVAFLGENASDYYGSNESELKFDLSVYGKTTVYYGGASNNSNQEMKRHYATIAGQQKGETVEVPSVAGAIIAKGVENIAFYKQQMVVAAEFNESRIGVLYSNGALHGAPISLNLIMNTILQTIVGPGTSIRASIKPLPSINTAFSPAEQSEVQIGVLWLILIPIGALFLMGTFIIYPNREHSSKFTQLQYMSGVKVYIYWLTNFFFDYFFIYIPSIVLVSLFLLISSSFGIKEYGVTLCILLSYGWGSIPFSYIFSLKQSASSGFALLLMIGLFTGMVPVIVVFAMEESDDEHYESVACFLRHIFMLLFPQFGLAYVATKFSRKTVLNYNWGVMAPEKKQIKCFNTRFNSPNPCCKNDYSKACSEYKDYFTGQLGIGEDLLEMLLPFVIYISLIIFLDSIYWKKGKSLLGRYWGMVKNAMNPKPRLQLSVSPTNNAGSSNNKEAGFYVDDLHKWFSDREVVNGVSFSVKSGQCFGLLGVNGAGKTTTFRMLTNDIPHDDGLIEIRDGKEAPDDVGSEKYFKKIGYCPQYDALNFDLSAKEILEVMARLRNFPPGNVETTADAFLQLFDLSKYAHKPCGSLSGGNKRKLALAVALLGCRNFILLDEPTSGVDPSSRRKIWNVINTLRKRNISFILTSHSMDECEALCENMAIMKEGKIDVEGSIPFLKSKYGTGITLKLKLKQNFNDTVAVDVTDGCGSSVSLSNKRLSKTVEDLKKEIQNQYNVEIRDEHDGLLHYHIKEEVALSKMFETAEELKSTFSDVVEDYSISGASLEDVFLTVARNKKLE